MQEATVFVTVTRALAYVPRNLLLKPGVHGFAHGVIVSLPGMLELFMLNMRGWCDAQDAPRQIVSGILFYSSLGAKRKCSIRVVEMDVTG